MKTVSISPFWVPLADEASALDVALDFCWASIDASVVSRPLAILDPLAPIDLPDATPNAEEQQRLRFLVPLYLCAALEETRLLDVAESIAGLFASGALPIADSIPAQEVIQFWRDRNVRFSAVERRAIFGRLFGTPGAAPLSSGPHNDAFEGIFVDVCDHLANEGRVVGATVVVARELVDNLLAHIGGLPELSARELLTTATIAVNIFKRPAVQELFGSRSMWAAVESAASRYLNARVPVGAFVTRGTSGVVVLSWLADIVGELGQGAAGIQLPEAAQNAAAQWLQASLQLAEFSTASARK